MDDSVLKWLLEPENPSVRYMTLTTWLNLGTEDQRVIEARAAIMNEGPVKKLLEAQNEDGSWGEPNRFYRDKYRGAVWCLLLLAELGADPASPKVQRACEHLLRVSQEPEEGGFSVDQGAKTGHGLPGMVIPCLTGNMVYALIKLGYGQDPRVLKAIDWICRYQRTDDGDSRPPKAPPYERFENCWGRHACHMGVAKTFKALTAIPEAQRNEAVTQQLDAMKSYFLKHHLYKKSHDLSQTAKPGWLRLGFPLMYQTDILELLSLFAASNHGDPRLEDALDRLREKRTPEGVWIMENSFNGKMRLTVEKKGQPSKWLTLKAACVLRAFENTP